VSAFIRLLFILVILAINYIIVQTNHYLV
jgi:hypothetical protein